MDFRTYSYSSTTYVANKSFGICPKIETRVARQHTIWWLQTACAWLYLVRPLTPPLCRKHLGCPKVVESTYPGPEMLTQQDLSLTAENSRAYCARSTVYLDPILTLRNSSLYLAKNLFNLTSWGPLLAIYFCGLSLFLTASSINISYREFKTRRG